LDDRDSLKFDGKGKGNAVDKETDDDETLYKLIPSDNKEGTSSKGGRGAHV
jgi:hypothetical protein